MNELSYPPGVSGASNAYLGAWRLLITHYRAQADPALPEERKFAVVEHEATFRAVVRVLKPSTREYLLREWK